MSKGNGSFYKWELIKQCHVCKFNFNDHFDICDNDCGSFQCDGCMKEYYAQTDENNQIIITDGHNPYCGCDSDDFISSDEDYHFPDEDCCLPDEYMYSDDDNDETDNKISDAKPKNK